jgi:hypothetical protein
MTKLTSSSRHTAGVCSIIAISVITYLPAVDNFFISDDFTIFPILQTAGQNPRWFFQSTTEFFRLMSYIYFGACFKLFGLSPEPYYWSGIALHALVSLLVYFLVLKITGRSLAAWAAAVFFAAYERHQEAVMWISAANETILTLSCLVFLLLWRRAIERNSATQLVLTHVIFVIALFSKEAAVVLLPLAMLGLLLEGYSLHAVLRKSIALLVITGAFAALWLSLTHRNFFITGGHYAFGWHFFPIYIRSLARLLSQTIPLVAAWCVIRYRHSQLERVKGINRSSPEQLSWNSSVVFFGSLLLLAIAPYCFLTYLNHIPSRNTYLPSVGLAGLCGILFAALYDQMGTQWSRRVCVLFLSTIVIANVGYIWLKKDPQYRERAAPTRELIQILNAQEIRDVRRLPVHVCGFPLDPWLFSEALARFTPFRSDEVVLRDSCDPHSVAVIQWDQNTGRYITNFAEFRDGPGGNNTVSAK